MLLEIGGENTRIVTINLWKLINYSVTYCKCYTKRFGINKFCCS